MSSLNEKSEIEKKVIFQTVFSSPGIEKKCKLSLSISHLNILVLARIIEFNLRQESRPFRDPVLDALTADHLEELRTVSDEILEKCKLTEFYQKLKLL